MLDPFSGSGTVPAQAAYMNRQYIGFELNNSYISMFEKYLSSTLSKQQKRYKNSTALKQNIQSFYNTIIQLRVLKYIKSILKYLKNKGSHLRLQLPKSMEEVHFNTNTQKPPIRYVRPHMNMRLFSQ